MSTAIEVHIMKITIAGTGYVGLSNAVLLAQHNEVVALDLLQETVDLINENKSPIVDKEISDFLANKQLNLKATIDAEMAYYNADYVSLQPRPIMIRKQITLTPGVWKQSLIMCLK